MHACSCAWLRPLTTGLVRAAIATLSKPPVALVVVVVLAQGAPLRALT